MLLLKDLKPENLNGKKVLLRVDFNVSVDKDGSVEDFKIKAHRETVNYLMETGALVAMISHVDQPLISFEGILSQISAGLGQKITFVSLADFLSNNYQSEANGLILVDNIRQDSREQQNNEEFAANLSKGFDLYVNDAFAVMHRDHASVSAITKHLSSYAGFLIKKETDILREVMDAPVEGKVLIMGGAKISTKLPVIKNFLNKAEKILIGGAIANDFFKSSGINVGSSLVDETTIPKIDGEIVILPQDITISKSKTGQLGTVSAPVADLASDDIIVDIGPQSAELFVEIIQESKIVIWNGPMGLSEVDIFAKGTDTIARAIINSPMSILGGGDTIAAVNKLGLLDKMNFVSTGGGAMLVFLSGERLPGLEALGYY